MLHSVRVIQNNFIFMPLNTVHSNVIKG